MSGDTKETVWPSFTVKDTVVGTVKTHIKPFSLPDGVNIEDFRLLRENESFEVGNIYKSRDNKFWIVLSTDHPGSYPLKAKSLSSEGTVFTNTWRGDGKWSTTGTSGSDLVMVYDPKVSKVAGG